MPVDKTTKQVDRLEALLDAIASLNGFSNPDSRSYQLRNPLLVKSFAKPGKHEIESDGVRVFNSSLAGTKASLFDLGLKVSGESRAGIKKSDTIANVLRVYGITEILGQKQIIKFLKRALKDENLSVDTPLTFFPVPATTKKLYKEDE